MGVSMYSWGPVDHPGIRDRIVRLPYEDANLLYEAVRDGKGFVDWDEGTIEFAVNTVFTFFIKRKAFLKGLKRTLKYLKNHDDINARLNVIEYCIDKIENLECDEIFVKDDVMVSRPEDYRKGPLANEYCSKLDPKRHREYIIL